MSKNISDDDLKIWEEFTKNMNNIENKDIVYDKENFYKNRIYVLDLHGSTLLEANKKVKNCINLSYASGIRHIKVITGKGRRSKNFSDPYVSKDLGILKNSIPDFIKQDNELTNKILKIKSAEANDGGEGAFYLLLKNFKE